MVGCASFAPPRSEDCRLVGIICPEEAKVERVTLQKLLDLPPPNQKAVVAVYEFKDMTGQRKPSNKMALFSTAVTQGAENYLIEALLNTGKGEWFVLAERGGLDHLTKERQLIKNTRKTYDGEGGNTLKPLLFAGILLEGGIVAYESDVKTGGNGARWLGVSNTSQYRVDEVTVSLRAVLVQTGEVLLNTIVSKTILSSGVNRDVFKFYETNTQLLEIETGYTRTEAVGYSVRSATETAVYEIIQEGLEKQFWDFDYSLLSEEVENEKSN